MTSNNRLQGPTHKYYSSPVVNEWLNYVYADEKTASHFPFGAARKLVLGKVIESMKCPRDTALDIGCGGGQLSIELARAGFKVKAIDFSERMLEQAAKLAKRSGVHKKILFSQIDFAALGADTTDAELKVNLAIAMGLIEYLDDDQIFFKTLHPLVAAGGYVLVEFRNEAYNALSGNRFTVEAAKSLRLEGSIDAIAKYLKVAEVDGATFREYISYMSDAIASLRSQPPPEKSAVLLRPFPAARRQHLLDDLVECAELEGFRLVDVLGLHPHPFLPILEARALREFNRIAWFLQQIPRNPLVILNCSSLAGVFRKG